MEGLSQREQGAVDRVRKWYNYWIQETQVEDKITELPSLVCAVLAAATLRELDSD